MQDWLFGCVQNLIELSEAILCAILDLSAYLSLQSLGLITVHDHTDQQDACHAGKILAAFTNHHIISHCRTIQSS